MREEFYTLYLNEVDATFVMVDRYKGGVLFETECIGFHYGFSESISESREFGLKVEYE